MFDRDFSANGYGQNQLLTDSIMLLFLKLSFSDSLAIGGVIELIAAWPKENYADADHSRWKRP